MAVPLAFFVDTVPRVSPEPVCFFSRKIIVGMMYLGIDDAKMTSSLPKIAQLELCSCQHAVRY